MSVESVSSPVTSEGPERATTPSPSLEPRPGPGALDAILALFVAALAFLLASTPARNSDLWLHLASGRAVAEGKTPLGVDPFASTTTGVFWVNHSWLSDWILYLLHAIGGDRALVIAKGILVALLAGLFFCFRRAGTRVNFLYLASAASILALGPWLVLQPALISLLGVVLSLYLLERPALLDDSRAERARTQRWLLVPLFILWANLDGWFVLGPTLVGLYALGEVVRHVLDREQTGHRGEIAALTLLTLAGLAACILTPYHYHTFAWPTPLGFYPAEQTLMHDPLGQGLVLSPFAGRFSTAPAFASPGGWAYCLLLVAGAASFALHGQTMANPGRLLAWLALAALSLHQARCIPFFAVVAGPVLALNVQEWARTVLVTQPPSRLQNLIRVGGVLGGVALLVLAWPGWLQPGPYQPRGWSVEPDSSLVRMAQQLQKEHTDGTFRADRFALTFSPEAAHHLAWFCPAEKGFLDSRWPLFGRVADDYVQMRRCFQGVDGPDQELGPLLDTYQIDRILLHDSDWDRITRAYLCLRRDSAHWELLALEGSAVLFGRRPAPDSPSHWKALDPRREAYHPGPDRRAPLSPSRPPQRPGLFDPFLRVRNDRSADRAEAGLWLLDFDLRADRMEADLRREWLVTQALGLIGSYSGDGSAGTGSALALRLFLTPLPLNSATALSGEAAQVGQQPADLLAAAFLTAHDRGPPEDLLLAVRAARRALAANPDDAGAFLLLGEAYLRLGRQTAEYAAGAAFPPLAATRQAQVLTSLEQAVFLRPDLDQAHALLAQLYFETGQMDRVLDHLQARKRIAAQEAAVRFSDPVAAERVRKLGADVEGMETLVQRSEKTYAANTVGKTEPSKVYERARLAARHGLARKALDMLLASAPTIFGKPGVQMQLDLMMDAGRAFEVRAWLNPDYEKVLGFELYHSLLARADAACGDLAGADAELATLSEKLRTVGITLDQSAPVRAAIALHFGGALLAYPVDGSGSAGLAGSLFHQFIAVRPMRNMVSLLGQEADIRVMRGMLALEAGAVEVAREHFHAALEVWGSSSQAATSAGVDFLSRPIAQKALRLLEVPSP